MTDFEQKLIKRLSAILDIYNYNFDLGEIFS